MESIYLSSGVNMLTNSLKISDNTQTQFIELILFQSNKRIWEKYCREELSNVLEPLTGWLPISVLTRGFLVI